MSELRLPADLLERLDAAGFVRVRCEGRVFLVQVEEHAQPSLFPELANTAPGSLPWDTPEAVAAFEDAWRAYRAVKVGAGFGSKKEALASWRALLRESGLSPAEALQRTHDYLACFRGSDRAQYLPHGVRLWRPDQERLTDAGIAAARRQAEAEDRRAREREERSREHVPHHGARQMRGSAARTAEARRRLREGAA